MATRQDDLNELRTLYDQDELSYDAFLQKAEEINTLKGPDLDDTNRTATVTTDAEPTGNATPLSDLGDWMTDQYDQARRTASQLTSTLKANARYGTAIALIGASVLNPMPGEVYGHDNAFNPEIMDNTPVVQLEASEAYDESKLIEIQHLEEAYDIDLGDSMFNQVTVTVSDNQTVSFETINPHKIPTEAFSQFADHMGEQKLREFKEKIERLQNGGLRTTWIENNGTNDHPVQVQVGFNGEQTFADTPVETDGEVLAQATKKGLAVRVIDPGPEQIKEYVQQQKKDEATGQLMGYQPGDLYVKNGTVVQVAGQAQASDDFSHDDLDAPFSNAGFHADRITALHSAINDYHVPGITLSESGEAVLVNDLEHPGDDAGFSNDEYVVQAGENFTLGNHPDQASVNVSQSDRYDIVHDHELEDDSDAIVGLYDHQNDQLITDNPELAKQFDSTIDHQQDNEESWGLYGFGH